MNKKQTKDDKFSQEINSLKNKANRLASMHSSLSDYYSSFNIITSSLILFLSVLLVGLTFVSEDFIASSTSIYPNTIKWLIGLASILIFATELIVLGFNLKEKAASHREAVRFYFKIMNKIRHWLDSGSEITKNMLDEIRDEYGRTDALPKIPEFLFLRLKQHHLRKIAISRELDKKPFESIRSIKRRLKSKTE